MNSGSVVEGQAQCALRFYPIAMSGIGWRAAPVRPRGSDAANGKFEQVDATPPHRHLHNAMEFAQRR